MEIQGNKQRRNGESYQKKVKYNGHNKEMELTQ